MPKSNETNFGNYFKLPNPGLRSYFDRVRVGQPDEYRTTFAKGSSLAKVLEDWKPTVDKLENVWPGLLDFENDLAKKVGPLSIMKPLSERMVDIDSYYDCIAKQSKPLDKTALRAVCSEWRGLSGLRMRSEQRTVDLMKKSTNSGSPYFQKRRLALKQTLPYVNVGIDGDTVLQYLNDCEDIWNACAILGWRGQEGGPTDDDVKQRVVWMFPLGVNIVELRMYQPAIEAAQKLKLVPAWVSMECVDERVTALFDTKGRDDLIICTDFSKFDQHFNSSLQDAAATIMRSFLKDAVSLHWLDTVFPIKYMIPLAYDYGQIRVGRHGMGSGSGGTNFDETLAHRALQYEAALAMGARLNPNSQCLGDDGILSYPGITVEDVMRSYTAHGLEMNQDKQFASTQECTYLRRWHHRDYREGGICVGVYSTYRALGRLCEQERYYDPEIWGPKMVALRQLSIIENCKYHPLREEFAQFCMARDKFRLGLDIPGFLDDISREAEKAMEVMPEFLGYTKSLNKAEKNYGIDSWWIVNYLRSQRTPK